MNFKSIIDETFKELNLIPINGQDSIIDRILTDFIINKKRNVILSAATGIGKSIIGAVVSRIITKLNQDEIDNADKLLGAMIVVHSNTLVKQYNDTFSKYGSDTFHQIIGSGNYECQSGNSLSLYENSKSVTAEDCFRDKVDKQTEIDYCTSCEYAIAKSYINKTDTLITNYTYHFISSMWTHHLYPRKIVIFDEAHTINDVFCEHNSIHVSSHKLEFYIKECENSYPNQTRDYVNSIKQLVKDINANKITEANYFTALKSLINTYKGIGAVFTKYAKEETDNVEYIRLKKIGKKYDDLACKIGDLFTYNYDHVFEDKPDTAEFTVKPIFVGNMSDSIMSDDYNLFMSATISDKFMIQTLNLKPEETTFINLDPVYDPDNKQLIFIDSHRLNFSSMKKPEILKHLSDSVRDITGDASSDGYKGLMLVPSFDVGTTLAKSVSKKAKVFLHNRESVKLNQLIEDFKSYDGPSILISPSIYEGLDFADDLSRYQLLIKAPFPGLGEKRMKYIADNYPDVYKIMTIMKIIQGVGRSVRGPDDWAITFILDSNIRYLFNSPLNAWKNQFSIA